ncbi:hypothetical protein, partial [Nostoc sp. DedVER01b]|uniref:hypothetical protein n=1 Tax=Nostoc sp. DedVER01b TaxID=3075404 RepID=UPI002AD52021
MLLKHFAEDLKVRTLTIILIPILYEDALNHIEVQEIRKRNEPQRTQRTQRKKLKGFGAASQRNGI